MTSTAGVAKRPAITTLCALTAGAMAAAAMGSAPTANATCASFFGIGSGGQCTSTLTSIAIAIGENAEAHADGILGAALTLGSSSQSWTTGLANLAVSLGKANNGFGNGAFAGGVASLAFAGRTATNNVVYAGEGDWNDGSVGNLAVSVASPEFSIIQTRGVGNLVLNIAGSGSVAGAGVGTTTVNLVGRNARLLNEGLFSAVANVIGDDITLENGSGGDRGTVNLGFNFIGNDNTITTRGTLALAGAIGSTRQTVSQDGLGVKISLGRRSAGAAANRVPVPAPSAATVVATADDTNSNRKARGAQTRANRSSR